MVIDKAVGSSNQSLFIADRIWGSYVNCLLLSLAVSSSNTIQFGLNPLKCLLKVFSIANGALPGLTKRRMALECVSNYMYIQNDLPFRWFWMAFAKEEHNSLLKSSRNFIPFGELPLFSQTFLQHTICQAPGALQMGDAWGKSRMRVSLITSCRV